MWTNDTCIGLCRGADRHHGTDAAGGGEFMDQLHAEFLAFRVDLCVYRRDSRAYSPSSA